MRGARFVVALSLAALPGVGALGSLAPIHNFAGPAEVLSGIEGGACPGFDNIGTATLSVVDAQTDVLTLAFVDASGGACAFARACVGAGDGAQGWQALCPETATVPSGLIGAHLQLLPGEGATWSVHAVYISPLFAFWQLDGVVIEIDP
jgi:hypothetical protein